AVGGDASAHLPTPDPGGRHTTPCGAGLGTLAQRDDGRHVRPTPGWPRRGRVADGRSQEGASQHHEVQPAGSASHLVPARTDQPGLTAQNGFREYCRRTKMCLAATLSTTNGSRHSTDNYGTVLTGERAGGEHYVITALYTVCM